MQIRYGLPLEKIQQLRSIGAVKAFQAQRGSAGTRGIEWQLTLAEWWGVWESSGRWDQRGHKAGQYVMGRQGDVGPYAIGNVSIETGASNIQFARSHSPSTKRSEAEGAGVFLLLSGLRKPWVAKMGRVFLGNFATMEEGTAARQRFREMKMPRRLPASGHLG